MDCTRLRHECVTTLQCTGDGKVDYTADYTGDVLCMPAKDPPPGCSNELAIACTILIFRLPGYYIIHVTQYLGT